MSIDEKDMRAAVSAGILNEAQAASVLALAQERQSHRQETLAKEEPFELFKGFNEIFIVVGLVVLYGGWLGITGFQFAISKIIGNGDGLGLSVIGMVGVALGAAYFTLKRRMVAPSNALTVMATISGAQFSMSAAAQMDLSDSGEATLILALLSSILMGWYLIFRIPFSMALVALSLFATALSFTVFQGAEFNSIKDLFLLSNDGPFAWITFALGVIGFAVAMSFDMSDPHRVSRRSAAGFYLHIVAAPAIVNTVALTLFEVDSSASYGSLVCVLTALSLVSIIIDRRSFLVAGVGYTVALSFIFADGSGAAWSILIIGAILVVLGAQWERLRASIMNAIPSFPGKTQLPPYGT